MKDKNGIEKECKNCDAWGYCKEYSEFRKECKLPIFQPRVKVYEARIAELQNELTVIQASERAEAQEADRLRAEIKEAKQIKESSESFYQKYSGVSEEYALGALEQCAIEADELQEKVNVLEKKLTETIKLLSERSRECGELEAHNEVLQRRIREFSMELLDRTMKENKDVLERLKQAESDTYKREAIQLKKKNMEIIDFLKEINRKLYMWKNEAKSLQVISNKLTEEATKKSMS